MYRAAYDRLERAGGDAEKRYLEVLKLAADEGVTVVENALEQLLATPLGVVSAKEVRGMADTWRERPPLPVSLSVYGSLLDGGEEDERLLEEVVA